jgi:hypothetical protein
MRLNHSRQEGDSFDYEYWLTKTPKFSHNVMISSRNSEMRPFTRQLISVEAPYHSESFVRPFVWKQTRSFSLVLTNRRSEANYQSSQRWTKRFLKLPRLSLWGLWLDRNSQNHRMWRVWAKAAVQRCLSHDGHGEEKNFKSCSVTAHLCQNLATYHSHKNPKVVPLCPSQDGRWRHRRATCSISAKAKDIQ